MMEFEYTEDQLFYLETMKKVKQITLTKNNLNLLNKEDILFIMISDEEMDFFDKYKIYYSRNKYDKEISDDDIYNIFPELKRALYDYNEDFMEINLGLGHSLIMRKEIYEDYMKILRSDIVYDDQYDEEQIYAAWNHWVDCAIKYINSKNLSC